MIIIVLLTVHVQIMHYPRQTDPSIYWPELSEGRQPRNYTVTSERLLRVSLSARSPAPLPLNTCGFAGLR